MSMSAEKWMRQHGWETTQRGFAIWQEIETKAPAALRMSADGSRQVSGKTRAERRRAIKAFVFRLVVDFPLHSIFHLKPKHLEAHCKYMEQKPLSAATICSTLSHLAVLCVHLGKPEFVRDFHRYFSNPKILQRSSVARREKTLESAGVNFMELYDKAHAIDPRVACQLALSWFYGLRVKESWCFRPHDALSDGVLTIERGTKGGRKRAITRPLTEEQHYLLEYAKSMTTKSGSMVDGRL